MAKASTSEVFNCTPEEFYNLVADYSAYPEFLAEVKDCKVLKEEGPRKLVEYQVNVLKTFRYTLWMTENRPRRISWEFAGGDIFKTMSGSWEMEDQAGKCKATYTVEATFGLFVPGAITKGLLNINLPNMISSYKKRIKDKYGK